MKNPLFSSWKTTVAGLLFVGVAICRYFKVDLPYDEITYLLAAIGLGFSKDYNVTGGDIINKEDVNK